MKCVYDCVCEGICEDICEGVCVCVNKGEAEAEYEVDAGNAPPRSSPCSRVIQDSPGWRPSVPVEGQADRMID